MHLPRKNLHYKFLCVKHALTIYADVRAVMSTSRKVVARMLKSCQNAGSLPFAIDGTVIFIPLLA